MFSKMVIFLFVLIGIFAVLFSLVPQQFFTASYDPELGTNKEVAEYYAVNNITMYETQQDFNLTYPGSQAYDFPGVSGHQLQYWWGNLPSRAGTVFNKVINVRHLTDQIFGSWWGWHTLDFDGDELWEGVLRWEEINERHDPELNGSLFEASCVHITLNFIIRPRQDYNSLANSWGNNTIRITTSYDINWNATGVGAFNILAQLLTFQNPNLGISGDAGTILNAFIAFPFWAMVAILIIKLIQSIIPFISGIDE